MHKKLDARGGIISHINSTENHGSNGLGIGEGFMEEVVCRIRESWNFSPPPPPPSLRRGEGLEIAFSRQGLMI